MRSRMRRTATSRDIIITKALISRSLPVRLAFDSTAHYWDFYPLEPGHGIDVDRTTPP